MVIISALIGFLTGITLTILTEVVKISSNRKLAAAKLYSSSVMALKQLLEYESMLSIAGAAKKIYYNKTPLESKKLLEDYMSELKANITKDKIEALKSFVNLKNNPIEIEKQTFLMDVIIDQYKKESLLITKQEVAYLSPGIQPMVLDMIENYFDVSVNYKYLLMHLKEDTLNTDQCIVEVINFHSSLIKVYRDRKALFDYSHQIVNRGIIRNIFN